MVIKSRAVHASALLVAACSIALPACGDAQAPEAAAELWERIQEQDYRSFARAPGYESRQPAAAPHSDFVDIYVNDVVAEALASSEPIDAWPTGSLLVKDGFTGDGELELVAVMEKREDGWFWAEYFEFETGEAKFSGKPDTCIDCHASGADYVRSFGFP